jgi:hypothetical protein
MGFLLATTLIFIFFLPGILFRRGYLSSNLSRSIFRTTPIDDLTWAIVPGLLLHVLGGTYIVFLTDYKIDIKSVLGLISFSDDALLIDIYDNLQQNIFPIVIYNTTLLSVAFFSGHLIRNIVRYAKLDIKYQFLRFSNKWFYILTGECNLFPEAKKHDFQIKDVAIIVADIVITLANKTYLYVGELINYSFTENGELDYLMLSSPRRRKLDDSSGNYYVIPSEYIILPAKEIKNINFRFFKLTKSKASEASVELLPLKKTINNVNSSMIHKTIFYLLSSIFISILISYSFYCKYKWFLILLIALTLILIIISIV